MPFAPTPHAVLAALSPVRSLALGQRAWTEWNARRERIIAQEKADPFRNCWEPPIWRVCDALLGFPWGDAAWQARMRAHLGFQKPVKVLLILGANRSSKTQYGANRVMRVLFARPGSKAWVFQSNLRMSIKEQQPYYYRYIPNEERRQKTETGYVKWSQKNGFPDHNFVLSAQSGCEFGSECTFSSYDQDEHSFEGGNVDIIQPDEHLPLELQETLEYRIAEKQGWMIVSFTPTKGHTATVRKFVDGARVAKESTGFLLPEDGGEPDVPRALGLSVDELSETERAARENRAAYCPQSRPQNCDAWLEGRTGQPEIPKGRAFARVPRVLQSVDPKEEHAVVYFHIGDNPYGNPKEIWAKAAGGTEDKIKERCYGIAWKSVSARFAKFNLDVHVVRPQDIPLEGTNYLVVDPCNGRNFFMKWYRVTPERVYLYREWPGPYVIPEVGLPGPWAIPGAEPDGRRGPAQDPFGWGFLRYKKEIARLEGWKDYTEEGGQPVEDWDEQNGAREVIHERFIDSRFASVPILRKGNEPQNLNRPDEPVTLLTEFEDIGLMFNTTKGDDINDGILMIQAAFDYETRKPVDYFNCPRFLISADCPNSIYAYQTYTGYRAPKMDGDSLRRNLDGACKDPVDCDRYFFLADCPYLGGSTELEKPERESEFSTAPARRYY